MNEDPPPLNFSQAHEELRAKMRQWGADHLPVRPTMPKMPDLTEHFTVEERQQIERNNDVINDTLNQLIQVVREHKAPYDVPCPPWCPGEPFSDALDRIVETQPRLVRAMLRNAVTRLAGHDTD